MDDVPEEERKVTARQVADKIIEILENEIQQTNSGACQG
jgi:hypothetical protein